MTSTRTRRRGPHPASAEHVGLRAPAFLSGLALLLTVTACGDLETEPEVDYDAIAESIAELPAVESVDSDGGGDAFTAEISAEADEAALRTTGSRIMRLLEDADVIYSSSPLTISSGPFTVETSSGYSDPHTGAYRSEHLDLMDLPHLRELPDVESGTLRNGTTTITLTEGTDLRTWVEDAVTRDGRSRVIAQPAQEDSPATATPDGTPGAAGEIDEPTAVGAHDDQTDYMPGPAESDELEESFGFHLGSEKSAEAVEKLYSAADSADAEVVAADVYSEGEVDADLEIESHDDLAQLDDVFAEEYDALAGFTFHTGDGFRLDYGSSIHATYGPGAPSIDEALAAHEQIEDLGATLTSVSEELQTAEVEAPDAEVLRAVADVVSSSDWPLEPAQDVSLSHPDSPDIASRLPAEDWGEHADIIASLWAAGFTSVTDRGGSSPYLMIHDGPGTDFRTVAGRDALIAALRSADWQGRAQITFNDAPYLTFESTVDGKALNPHNPEAGTSAELSDWGQEFVDAWDATAG